jgi:hypothetical protein
MVGFLRQLAGVLIGSLVTLFALGQFGAVQPLPVAGQSEVQIDGTASIEANAPNFINYQGQLFNPNTGVPFVNAPVNASFRLYRDGAGTQQIYQEDKVVTTNVDGFFTTAIGDTNVIVDPASLFNGQELFLGVVINGEALRPFQRINYVPYAQWARAAGRLDNYTTRDFPKIVAFGLVNANGSRITGRGFSSSRQLVAGETVYVLDIDGIDHSIERYTTLVTPSCNRSVMTGVGTAAGGDLIVDMFDQNGFRTECRFQFMVFDRE